MLIEGVFCFVNVVGYYLECGEIDLVEVVKGWCWVIFVEFFDFIEGEGEVVDNMWVIYVLVLM